MNNMAKIQSQSQGSLVETAMEMLTSIPDISVEKQNNSTFLLKENKKFCVIRGRDILLLDQNREYKPISNDIFQEKDRFLEEATKSIWVATKKV